MLVNLVSFSLREIGADVPRVSFAVRLRDSRHQKRFEAQRNVSSPWSRQASPNQLPKRMCRYSGNGYNPLFADITQRQSVCLPDRKLWVRIPLSAQDLRVSYNGALAYYTSLPSWGRGFDSLHSLKWVQTARLGYFFLLSLCLSMHPFLCEKKITNKILNNSLWLHQLYSLMSFGTLHQFSVH